MPRGTDIDAAATILARGGLVALPTETVYGLGADASNPEAVARIYAVKGRPAGHPLIVHVRDASVAARWAADFSPLARRLAAAFWPGPLTLIVPAGARTATAVTGGGTTIGLRVPAHPVAQALLAAFADGGGGIAAPSANRFGAVSPTTADHVQADLGDAVDYLLDGGACQVGVESTIVDVSRNRAVLLRSGGIASSAVAAITGELDLADAAAPAAPGTLASHYAPRTHVIAVAPAQVEAIVQRETAGGRRVAILAAAAALPQWRETGAVTCALPDDPAPMAQALYARLREIDALGFDVIVAALPAASGLGEAVGDRLRRAGGPR